MTICTTPTALIPGNLSLSIDELVTIFSYKVARLDLEP